MTERPGYPMLRPNGTSPATEVALVVNGAMQGRLNCVLDVAVEEDVDWVALSDERFSVYSMLLTEPGSSITGHTFTAGSLMLSVAPGPGRLERILVVG